MCHNRLSDTGQEDATSPPRPYLPSLNSYAWPRRPVSASLVDGFQILLT